jgi:hypothetical protein
MGGKLENDCFRIERKPADSVCTVGASQNSETVRQSFIRSGRLSARRDFVALEITGGSARRILYKDLKFPSVQNGGRTRIKAIVT